MGRKLRFIPEGGALVEVTCRTIHGRFLLRPGRDLNEIVIGALARAKERYPVALVGSVCLSNHIHHLAWVEEAETLSRFMGYVGSKIAREVGLLHGWRDKVWARRYQGIVVSDEEAAQVERFKYLLAQGAKEGLVARPQDWPGVHCADSLVTGEPLRGLWFDRTKEWTARRRGQKVSKYQFAEEHELVFDKLPCWAHLSDGEYGRRVAALLEEIEEEAAVLRREKGIVLPRAKVCSKRLERVNPHDAPPKSKKSSAPAFHTATKAARQALKEAYDLFLAAYRAAAGRLRDGDRDAAFPEGSFPPALPFVMPASARGP